MMHAYWLEWVSAHGLLIRQQARSGGRRVAIAEWTRMSRAFAGTGRRDLRLVAPNGAVVCGPPKSGLVRRKWRQGRLGL
mgnify:CR=1 FL=1